MGGSIQQPQQQVLTPNAVKFNIMLTCAHLASGAAPPHATFLIVPSNLSPAPAAIYRRKRLSILRSRQRRHQSPFRGSIRRKTSRPCRHRRPFISTPQADTCGITKASTSLRRSGNSTAIVELFIGGGVVGAII
jgi:hypothetical protein